MTHRSQVRLIFHGALFMLISMAVESPGFIYAVHHGTDDLIRQYLRQSHSVLMVTGIWMIATSAILPLLELTQGGITGGIITLVWSLVISGYTFMLAMAVFIAALWYYRPVPQPTQMKQLMALPHHLGWINLGLIAVSGITSLLPGFLIVQGAYLAMRDSPVNQIH